MAEAKVREVAGRWLAVSTSGQDEESQEPDVDGWIADHDYTPGKTYRLHGVSRYKGTKRHDAELAKVIRDMSLGVINVLVVWASDRIERRGAYNAFDLARRVREAGGRIEYVKDTLLNETNEMSDVMLAFVATKDRQESKRKSERVIAKHAFIRANGGLVGLPPWGYTSEGDKYARHMVPTPEGRQYIPQIFTRVAKGESLASVCRWLDSEGVKPFSYRPAKGDRPARGLYWSPKSVAQMVRRRTYMGQRQDATGLTVLDVPALVNAGLWRRANKRLDSAPVGRRGAATCPSALLTSHLSCPRCASPMYRIGKLPNLYYRCSGQLPNRKGCGNMVPLAALDALTVSVLSQASDPWTEQRLVPGTNHEAEMARVQLAMRDLSAKAEDLSDDDYDTALAGLRAERDALKGMPTTPDRVEVVATGRTVGQHWASLDADGQREILDECKLYAEMVNAGGAGRVPSLRIESRLFRVPQLAVSAESTPSLALAA